MEIPDDRRYTRDHEWARLEDGRLRIGITDYAQDALGDVVFVKLPDVDSTVEAGGPCSEVESTKSVSDVYSPVAGKVVAINTPLADVPQAVNDDPYGEGWICFVEPTDPSAYESLLDAAAYKELLSE